MVSGGEEKKENGGKRGKGGGWLDAEREGRRTQAASEVKIVFLFSPCGSTRAIRRNLCQRAAQKAAQFASP